MRNLLTTLSAIQENQLDIPKSTLGPGTVEHGLQIFFGVAGGVAMIIIALGAFRYVISRGDPSNIKNAKETIIYAAIGLVITMAGYGIVTFVVTKL